jgi:uracil-DNA glycosylase family 4
MKLDPSCKRCPLHLASRNVCVGPEGPNPVSPRVVFVTGVPGWDREPRALLRAACEEYGIEDYCITPVVKCEVPGQRNPYVREMRACSGYLAHQLAKWSPDVVVPLGNTALQALTNQKGITKYAGRVLDDGPYVLLPMLHPSAIVRDERKMPEFETGFAALKTHLEGEKVSHRYKYRDRRATEERLIDMIDGTGPFSIDLETTALNPRFGQIRTFAICEEEGEAWWAQWDDGLRDLLADLLTSGRPMIAHNAVFEVKWLLWHVIRPSGRDWRTVRWPVEDSLLLHHLIHEEPPHNLSVLAKMHTSIGGYDDEMELFKISNEEAYKTVPITVLGNYNAGDADACFRLQKVFRKRIAKHDRKQPGLGLADLYWEITEPSIWVVAHCELHGRKFDVTKASELHKELLAEEEEALHYMLNHKEVKQYEKDHAAAVAHAASERETLAAQLRFARKEKQAGMVEALVKAREQHDKAAPKPLQAWGGYPEGTWNPNSNTQLPDLLFNRLKTPVRATTDGGAPSAAEKHLVPVQDHHPFIPVYLKWKKANTLRQRYLEKRLLPYVRKDGFVYGSYLIHGTGTGRWSSSDPNLQNIAPRLKDLFVSRFPGGSILEADFSQLELRLVAWASHCEPLLEAFRKGEDVHLKTANGICREKFGRDANGKEERKLFGKTPNFGLTYCAGPQQFAVIGGLSLKDATDIREMWLDLYWQIPAYMKKSQRIVERTGEIQGFLGRVRRLRDHDHYDTGKKFHALLAGSNFPIQNLAAELNAWAFARAAAEIARRGMESLPLGATHDSMTFDCPPDEVYKVGEICRYWMTDAIALRFPWLDIAMGSDPEAGPTWGSMVALETA